MKKEKILTRHNDKLMSFVNDYKNASNAASGSKFDSNANVTQRNIATLQCELGKEEILKFRQYTIYKYIQEYYGEDLADKFLEDEDNHIIYPNDSTSLMPYCASISLYPFLLNGLKELGFRKA